MIEMVPAPRARELIGHALQLFVADMHAVRDDVWVRPLTDEIRAVVQINALKGAQYDINYGICCAWVPVSSTSRGRISRFPRTMKQITMHLWVDHFTPDAKPRQWISTLDGEKVLRRHAHRAVQQVMDRAPAWWRSVDNPEGVLAEARRRGRNQVDIHFPRARTVAAFTLARLGDLAAARSELSAAGETEEVHELLPRIPVPSSS